MNFRFTKWKTIVSLIFALIIGAYAGYGNSIFGSTPNYWIWVQILTGIVNFVIVFVIIYVIWSLIEKRE